MSADSPTLTEATELAVARRIVTGGGVLVPTRALRDNFNSGEWPDLRVPEADLAQCFNGQAKPLSLLTGEPSAGLAVIEVACSRARLIGTSELTKTDARAWQREGAEYHFYRAEPVPESQTFHDPACDEDVSSKIVRLHSTGSHVPIPSGGRRWGEPVVWRRAGHPAKVDGSVLVAQAKRLAAAALLGRYWPEEDAKRQQLAEALACGLLRGGEPAEQIEHFIGSAAEAGEDYDLEMRLEAVDGTTRRLMRDGATAGWPRVAAIVGDRVVRQVREWLGVESDRPAWSWLTSYSAPELSNQPPIRRLIDGLLARNSLAALVGLPESLKTFVALDWALSIAQGRPWHGREVHQGPVLYISAEGVAGLPVRVRAWELASRCTAPDACRFITLAPQLANPVHVEELLALIDAMPEPPIFIVFDTLARVTVGHDENSALSMGLVVEAAERIRRASGACVLFLHHVDKARGQMRGSSALPGALDTIIEANRDGDTVTLHCGKQKDGRAFDPIGLEAGIVDLGNGESSVTLRPVTAGSSSTLEQRVADVLATALAGRPATDAEWLAACLEARISRRSYYRAKKSLLGTKAVTMKGTGRGARYQIAEQASASV